MWNIKQKATNKKKLTDIDNNMVVTRIEGDEERVKWVEGVEYMVTEGKQTERYARIGWSTQMSSYNLVYLNILCY